MTKEPYAFEIAGSDKSRNITCTCPHGHTITSGVNIDGKTIRIFRHRDCKGTITHRIYNPELIAYCANCEWKTSVGLSSSGKTLGFCDLKEATK